MPKAPIRVVQKQLSDLSPDPENPRTLSPEARQGLQASLERFGMVSPIIWNESTGEVVGGHQRLKVLQDLGVEKVRVVVWNGSKEEQRALNVSLNNPAIMGDWDDQALGDRLEEIRESIGDEAFLSLRLEQLRQEIEDDLPLEGNTDPDDIPEDAGEETKTKPGDLWILGPHKLLCADAGDPAAIQRLMDGRVARLLATDPPYGVDFDGLKYETDGSVGRKDWGKIEGDALEGDALREWFAGVLALWLPHLDPQAAVYIWSAPLEPGYALLQAIRDAGLHVQAQIIWAKNSLILGQADYHWKHEVCWYAFQKGENHRWLAGRDKTTVWEVDRVPAQKYAHPMQKPTELYARPIQAHTHHGETILDLFAGSGTSLIAAEQLGRICYAVEIDPKFCDVAVQRWEEFTGKGAHRMGGKA